MKGELYIGFLELMLDKDVSEVDEPVSCRDILLDFNGSGNVAQYWIRDFYNDSKPSRCKLTKNEVT